jgi:hypothetical protein
VLTQQEHLEIAEKDLATAEWSIPQSPRDSSEWLFPNLEPSKRAEWIRRFPTLVGTRYLVVKNDVPQEILEGICTIPAIERMWLYRVTAPSLRPLERLGRVTHLQLGLSKKVSSLEPIAKLGSLKALGLSGTPPLVRELSPIGALKELQAFWFFGSQRKSHVVESFEPLRSLAKLRYLSLHYVKNERDGLDVLGSLGCLEYFAFGPVSLWPRSEYLRLFEQYPNSVAARQLMSAFGNQQRR